MFGELTTDEVEGYPSIRAGFRKIIIESLNQAIANHPHVLREIEDHLETLGKFHKSSKPPEITASRTPTPPGATSARKPMIGASTK